MNEREPMLQAKLSEIQQKLKAPKNQRNNFGGYEYRSCEDILNALKPLLGGAVILLADEIVQIGERYYVKATATLKEGEETIVTTAYAREEENKKGMDGAQVTGAASSYARKYALNGLFAIDDSKDADFTNTHGKTAPKQEAPQHPTTQPEPQQTTIRLASDGQRKAIFAICKSKGIEIDAVKEALKIPSMGADLTMQQASQAIDWLNKQ